jgi:hypothetical protein
LTVASGTNTRSGKFPVAQAVADEDGIMDVIPAEKRSVPDVDEDDDDAGDGGIGTLIPYRNPKALAAYYFGFFSLIPVAGLLAAPFGVVLGVLGLKAVRANPDAKGGVHAWIGIIFGMISLLCNSLFLVLLSLPSMRQYWR